MTINELLLLLNLILNAVIATFWFIYVRISNKTFKEIKRQTDLQSDAFLLVTCETPETKPGNAIDKEHATSVSYHQEWEDIIKRNIPEAVGRNQYLVLILGNKGSCDISKWKINITLTVDPGEYLKGKYHMPKGSKYWSIEQETNVEQIAQKQDIPLFVAKVGAYPEATLRWTIEYSDIRGKNYTIFGGPDHKTVQNSLAFSKSPEQTPNK